MSILAVIGVDLPAAMSAVLRDRRRTFQVQTGVPTTGDDLRGVVIGPEVSGAEVRWLLDECLQREIPALVFGAPARLVLGGTPSPTEQPELHRVELTPAATEDPVTAATMPGAPVIVTEVLSDTEESVTVLLRDEHGAALLGRRGTIHATPWRLDVQVSDTPEVDAHASFLVAHAAALLGRWIDAAVGRTDEEQPWGRRGPQPVAAPGLSLNPA
jgi:hypothetical protein